MKGATPRGQGPAGVPGHPLRFLHPRSSSRRRDVIRQDWHGSCHQLKCRRCRLADGGRPPARRRSRRVVAGRGGRRRGQHIGRRGQIGRNRGRFGGRAGRRRSYRSGKHLLRSVDHVRVRQGQRRIRGAPRGAGQRGPDDHAAFGRASVALRRFCRLCRESSTASFTPATGLAHRPGSGGPLCGPRRDVDECTIVRLPATRQCSSRVSA